MKPTVKELREAYKALEAAELARLCHENSRGDWAISGQMRLDNEAVYRCKRKVEELEEALA